MKTSPAPNPTFFGALKNIGRGLYNRTAKFSGYSAANPGPTRPIGNRLGTNTNSTFAQMQRVGMNFTAEMVTKDNPLASAYLAQRQNYCSSQMIYIPSTPDAGLNRDITQYLHGYDGFGGLFARMGVSCSMQDAFMRTADLETPVRGDAGLIWWRENENEDLRLIEFSADQLGEIYNFTLSRQCSLARNANGDLCEVAGKDCLYYQGRYFRGADCVAYKIYERTESFYGFGKIYAASDVLYFRDPASFRGVRGVTAFANSIAHMQKSEDLLQSALSAAQRQARTYGRVFNEAGEPDEPSYETSDTGRITFFEKIPGAPIEEYYFNGDSAEFAAPNTPSAEVISGIHTAQELACLGLRMPFAFLVNPNAVGGAPSRLEVEKADKEFQRIQNTIHRPHLRTIADMVLLDAMQRGLIVPPRGMTSAQFKQGRWMLPVSPSVDAFYDCKENIDMVRAGLEAPQDIIAETNRNADDVLRKTKEWAVKVQMARQDANRELEAAGYKGEVSAMDIAQVTDNPPQQPAQSGEQSETNTAAMAEWDESKHHRGQPGNAGEFGPGGGTSTIEKPKTKKQEETKSEKAKSAAVHVGSEVQRYADVAEQSAAKALKGVSFKDSEPVDVVVGREGVVEHGIEFKAVVLGANDKLTMNSYAQVRKIEWEKKNKATFHTLVFDDRKVYSPDGKHDESKREIYYRRGVAGSARLGSLYKCKDLKEANALMAMDEKKLPDAAKRTDGKLRAGRWKFFQDEQGKGYRNIKTGETFRAKK